jgi:hypothetical protein
LVNRAETKAGDDARALKGVAAREVKQDRAMYRYYTGSSGSKKARKSDPRKYPKPRASGR